MSSPSVRVDLASKIQSGERIVLEFGCGLSKGQGRIGIDHLDLPGVDIVADLNHGLGFLPDNCVDEIHARSLFEHLTGFNELMPEMIRVLKPGGRCHAFVPHFSNPYYYSDPTHVRFFGLYTFFYWVDEAEQPRRKVPTFYSSARIRVIKLKLKFSSPFRPIRFFRKLVSAVVNASPALQEWYEGSFTGIVPCYGIEIIFEPVK